jgi:hypothetical protein
VSEIDHVVANLNRKAPPDSCLSTTAGIILVDHDEDVEYDPNTLDV